jgi:hypothetical protein
MTLYGSLLTLVPLFSVLWPTLAESGASSALAIFISRMM